MINKPENGKTPVLITRAHSKVKDIPVAIKNEN